eukprot:scaffold511959_cov46-Prasinocladus_malaysianus.AAC.1
MASGATISLSRFARLGYRLSIRYLSAGLLNARDLNEQDFLSIHGCVNASDIDRRWLGLTVRSLATRSLASSDIVNQAGWDVRL